MDFYVYIDESGPFDNALSGVRSASIVGGVCSRYPNKWWEDQLRKTASRISNELDVNFRYPNHFHCMEVRHRQGFLPGKKLGNLPTTREHSDDVKAKITDTVIDFVVNNIEITIVSVNRNSRFEYSPQATYVVNLIAALKKQFEVIAAGDESVDSVTLYIAQRTIEDTVQANRLLGQRDTYNQALLRYVRDQIKIGNSAGAKLAEKMDDQSKLTIEMQVAERFAGLMAADFACYYMRGKKLPDGKPHHSTGPDEVIFGDYRRFYEKEVTDMISSHHYSTALQLAYKHFPTDAKLTNYKKIFEALGEEQDPHILLKELGAITSFTEYLINTRSVESTSLETVLTILNRLRKEAKTNLDAKDSAEQGKSWAHLYINVLGNISRCLNYSGKTEGQDEIEEELEQAMKTWGKVLSLSSLNRREMMLEIKTANKNMLFNDYRFEDVISSFEDEVHKREELIGDDYDSLLGQMLGTIGQACSFLSHLDDSWVEMAEEYFIKSLTHFEPGTLFYSMSSNYLATMYACNGELDKACAQMCRHTTFECDDLSKLDTVKTEILMSADVSPFDLVNFIRIIGLAEFSFTKQELEKIDSLWSGRIKISSEHPSSLIAKWLGVLLLQNDENEKALNFFEASLTMTADRSFTVKSLGLPVYALQLIASKTNAKAKKLKEELTNVVQELYRESESFQNHIEAIGGMDRIDEIIAEKNVLAASQLLPFSYA